MSNARRALARFACRSFVGALLVARASAQSAPPAPDGAALYYPCSACHMPQGEGSEALRAPGIGGLTASYLDRQLRHFRAGLRGAHPLDSNGQQMTLLAKALGDAAAMQTVSRYISGLAAGRPPRTLPGNARRGRRLYANCATCHGAVGEGDESLDAPALRSQGDWYLLAQWQAFRRGWRGMHAADAEGQRMRAVLRALPDDAAARDVIAYIQTLP